MATPTIPPWPKRPDTETHHGSASQAGLGGTAIEQTGRRQLIMGAITTDICLVFPSISAVEDGYEVQAVMDSCGSPFEINEAMSRERLKAAGVQMTVTNTTVAELVKDWSSRQGQQLVQLLFAASPMQPVD